MIGKKFSDLLTAENQSEKKLSQNSRAEKNIRCLLLALHFIREENYKARKQKYLQNIKLYIKRKLLSLQNFLVARL